jgi:hypothetical protein
MSNEEWELAAGSKAPFTVYYGSEENIVDALAGNVQGNAGESE